MSWDPAPGGSHCLVGGFEGCTHTVHNTDGRRSVGCSMDTETPSITFSEACADLGEVASGDAQHVGGRCGCSACVAESGSEGHEAGAHAAGRRHPGQGGPRGHGTPRGGQTVGRRRGRRPGRQVRAAARLAGRGRRHRGTALVRWLDDREIVEHTQKDAAREKFASGVAALRDNAQPKIVLVPELVRGRCGRPA